MVFLKFVPNPFNMRNLVKVLCDFECFYALGALILIKNRDIYNV